jgi:hypothetical protein
LKDGDVPDNFESLSADEAALVALGYKQEFKREFSLWTTFCVSFAVLGLLPSFASTLYYGMGYAGTGGMVWGWLISWVFIQCVAMGMAELCSSMPTRYVKSSGGDEVWLLTFAFLEKWWSLLCFCSSCPSRMGSLRCLGNWLVKLALVRSITLLSRLPSSKTAVYPRRTQTNTVIAKSLGHHLSIMHCLP